MKPILFEHAIDVPNKAAQIFAVLENVDLAPKWMDRCLRLEKLSKTPTAIGSKFRYTYKDGARKKTMEVVATAYTANERLCYRCTDAAMALTLDFRLRETKHGTRVTHTAQAEPKSLLGRLLAPWIQGRLRRRGRRSMRRLHALLESRNR